MKNYTLIPQKGKYFWNNWTNYLRWTDSRINSLINYIKYFNPNYFIYGQTLEDWNGNEINGSDSVKQNSFFELTCDNNVYNVYFVGSLSYHEGLLNRYSTSYIYFGTIEQFIEDIKNSYTLDINYDENKITIQTVFSNIENFFSPFVESGVIFSLYVPQHPSTIYDEERKDPNNYSIIVKNAMSAYLILNSYNTLSATYYRSMESLGHTTSFDLNFNLYRYAIAPDSDSVIFRVADGSTSGNFQSSAEISSYDSSGPIIYAPLKVTSTTPPTEKKMLWKTSIILMTELYAQTPHTDGDSFDYEPLFLDYNTTTNYRKLQDQDLAVSTLIFNFNNVPSRDFLDGGAWSVHVSLI